MTRTKVLVIGAGPYGIAVAHEVWARGFDVVVVGEPFELWRRHTLSSMVLRSGCRASEIYARDRRYSLSRFLARNPSAGEQPSILQGDNWGDSRIPVRTFLSYLDDVVGRLPFVLVQERIVDLDRRADGFRAASSQGAEIEAHAVIVATGLGSHCYLPPPLDSLSESRLLHSWRASEIEEIHGQRVLVIGGGQSSAEIVAHLRVDNQITWALRHRPLFMREPLRLPPLLFRAVLATSHSLYRLPTPLVRTLGRAIFYTTITPDLRTAFADPEVRKVYAAAGELGLRETAAGIFAGVTGETFDYVVAATGFRFALGNLPFLSETLRSALGTYDRPPDLNDRFETAVENLYMVGGIAESTFGPAMRFIFGSRPAARHLGRQLAKTFDLPRSRKRS